MSSQTTTWWHAVTAVPAVLAEDVSGLLFGYGALGCEIVSADVPLPQFSDSDSSGGPAAPLLSPDAAALLATFPIDMSREDVADNVRAALSDMGIESTIGDVSIESRDDTEWLHAWKRFFKPLQIGEKLWIVPSWEDDASLPDGAITITLDPGLAFGTGQHATTALCLSAIEKHLATVASPCSMLDVGCGSGILSIGAAHCGAAPILGIDVDLTAVDVARENVEINEVRHAVSVSGDPVEDVEPQFNLVVANILATILIPLAQPIAARVAPGGTLILSGILTSQVDEVVAAYARAAEQLGFHPFVSQASMQKEDWVALSLTRPAHPA